jgi:hypothetical protein
MKSCWKYFTYFKCYLQFSQKKIVSIDKTSHFCKSIKLVNPNKNIENEEEMFGFVYRTLQTQDENSMKL